MWKGSTLGQKRNLTSASVCNECAKKPTIDHGFCLVLVSNAMLFWQQREQCNVFTIVAQPKGFQYSLHPLLGKSEDAVV